jgi:integrase
MTTEADFDGARVRPIPWAKFRAEVLAAWPGPPSCSRSHARMVRLVLGKLEALGLGSTAGLTLGTVARFHAALDPDLSPFSVRTYLATLRCLCALAYEHRWAPVNPFALRPMRRWVRTGRPAGKRHLTAVECRRLLDEVLASDVATRKGWAAWRARRLQLVACLALYCGLRREELLRLQVSDLDLPGRLIGVKPHGRALKTEASEDTVPIPEAIVPMLSEWLAHWRLAGPEGYPVPADCPWLVPTINRRSPWVGGSPGSRAFDQLAAAGDRAGLRVNFQVLRRTCATMLEAKGVAPATIARILRHSEAVDAAFYRRRDEDSMRRAARDLEF